MPPKRRSFERRPGERPYRRLFIVAVEGSKTEPQYFAIFKDDKSIIRVNCLKSKNKSSPPQVLKRMEDYLKKESLRKSDEAWLVVDKDGWTDEQLVMLYKWKQSGESKYGFALSNPKFEYWLLLHFEDGTGISTSSECSDRLKRYLSNYDKGIDVRKISKQMIIDAIRRAKSRDNPPCADWPKNAGCTTVYKLVEKIVN